MYESILEIRFIIQVHLQNLRIWWSPSIPYLEAEVRQESLVAALGKDLDYHNQLFIDETSVK